MSLDMGAVNSIASMNRRRSSHRSRCGSFTRPASYRGMRVLDVGSGAGHVALLAAELVGPTGEVIGTDRAATAVAAAQALVRARTLHQVSFREGDPTELTFERPFDAVVGRYVLMFQPDPAAMLRKIRRHLRPGGVIAFHESHLTSAHSVPPA